MCFFLCGGEGIIKNGPGHFVSIDIQNTQTKFKNDRKVFEKGGFGGVEGGENFALRW